MKNYFIIIFLLLAFNVYTQEYRWTGNSNNNDFFDELNWVEFISNNTPPENSINPGQSIGFSLYLTCEIFADGEIILNENGKIIFKKFSCKMLEIYATYIMQNTRIPGQIHQSVYIPSKVGG